MKQSTGYQWSSKDLASQHGKIIWGVAEEGGSGKSDLSVIAGLGYGVWQAEQGG